MFEVLLYSVLVTGWSVMLVRFVMGKEVSRLTLGCGLSISVITFIDGMIKAINSL